MNIHEGSIKTSISEQKLQQLAMEVLLAQDRIPAGLKSHAPPAIKAELIAGIIAAERRRWRINDDFPSIPGAWGRALFAMSLPVRGIAEMDDAGWVAAMGLAGGLAMAILFSQPVGWAALAGAGLGIALIEGAYAVGAAVIGDINTTVGRGQIGQAAWDDALRNFGSCFKDYLDLVFQEARLKTRMQLALKAYKLNDISVKYNPMAKENVQVLENFMIGAVLLDKVINRMKPGRSAADAIKYGIAIYHGVGVDTLNTINAALGFDAPLEFPAAAASADNRLSSKQQDIIRYVYEVYNYEYAPAN